VRLVALEHNFRDAFEVCPVCGGELAEKEVEKLLRGGNDTATLLVDVLVCLHCGERLYPEDTVRRFERIRSDLAHERTADLEPIGRAYRAS
jgi:YgiT-type zinc finger domain-containing protein